MTHVDTAATAAIYAGLFVTGLASSLHCVGMCGPIIVGFSRTFQRVPLTINGYSRPASLLQDFVWYHVGRVWTYSLLGFATGWLGRSAITGSAGLGWQRAISVGLGGLVVLSGLMLWGISSRFSLDRWLKGFGLGKIKQTHWFGALTSSPGVSARLLLGAVMGFLPCGVVYAVLAVVLGLPSPWHSAAGMAVFGLGTVPSLSAVVLANRVIPVGWRAYGTRLTAAIVVATGLWMTFRALAPHDHCHDTAIAYVEHPRTP